MLYVTSPRYAPKPPSLSVTASRKLRKAYMKRLRAKEYQRLKNIIPATAKKHSVDKVTVVEEAIRYIDHLHEALAQKLQQIGSSNPQQAAMLELIKKAAFSHPPTSSHLPSPSSSSSPASFSSHRLPLLPKPTSPSSQHTVYRST